MRTLFTSHFCLISLMAITFSQTTLAAEGLTQVESNALVKEDIAGTQVLSEVCPALIGKQAKFEQNIQKLIQINLKEYSDQSMTFATLQNDAEYKSLLAEAHITLKETSTEEQKSVCEDVLSFQE
ncbi:MULTISPECIES: MCR_0457 family protein [unclassified Acinetobacter]|uniref:MCR_0457 family protein n=1 Tax=unclassified Acinetobacter TaxID=196816 RepID=UPI00190D4619|nr:MULTISPECIES: hypothetical protein [unclassified Acinetobacter]MBK0062290.1 hypothetical protein [Acinetobacter sp. S55]MBK0066094.1 hypothetical protein [Acinetobacter sp. S54]